MADHSSVEIIWHGSAPSLDHIAMVRASIRDELEDLRTPAELVFHVVFLSRDPEGPTATIWGEKGSAAFHGEWSETTVWEPLDATQ